MSRIDNERPRTVTERVRRARNDLAPAERRVVESLLADYPMAGLGSVGSLAAAAGVSAPTVLRLLTKLGFEGYTDFREQLRGEVSARIFSGEDVYPGPAGGAVEHPLRRAERAYAAAVHATFRGLEVEEVDGAVAALVDHPHVLVGGGRFSAAVAAYMAWLLQTLRPGTEEVPPDAGHRTRALLSVSPQTLVVVFDYWPYQSDTVEFANDAARRGADVLLVCDRNLSPIAPTADFVLATAVDGPPPFDSIAGGLMVVETLLSAIAARLGEPARQRLLDFEAQLHPPGEAPERDFGIA